MTGYLYRNGKKADEKLWLQRIRTEEVGLFESLRTYRKKIFRKDEHLRRLKESAQTILYPFPLDLKKISKDLDQTLDRYYQDTESPDDVFIRLTLWQDQVFILVTKRTHPPEIYEKGVRLRTSPVKRSLSNSSFPETKTSAYQNAVLASLEPNPDSIYEWVFLNKEGYLTEVRIGNLFMVKDGALFTPTTVGILNGVTRRFVIECAEVLDIPVREKCLTRYDVFTADEAFLTNTSWEILPVRELDGRKIGNQVPGKITLSLHRQFKRVTQNGYPC